MTTLREQLRGLVVQHGLVAVHRELQSEMRETYAYLREIFEPPKNNLVIPMQETIPDRIASPMQKPNMSVLSLDIPPLDLHVEHVEESHHEEPMMEADIHPQDLTLKEVVIQAKSEMNKQATGERFSKAKHREDVAKKHKELMEKGIRPESLLTKENLTQWLGSGMSYMRIARELTGVHENEIAAIAKTFGLQSDIKKYIVMKKK